MAAVNGSCATKPSAVKHPSSSTCQQNGTHRNGPMIKPQISIEEAPPSNNQSPSHYRTPSNSSSPVHYFIPSPGSRRKKPRRSNGARLKATPPNAKKSDSLPSGVGMMAKRISSGSCGTPESDSCSSDGRHSAELNGEPPKYEAGLKQLHKGRLTRSDSLDSELYLNSTTDDDSSVETDASPEPGLRNTFGPRPDSSLAEGEDDVFQDGGLDICSETDTKLVDWAFNVFVPTCYTLLDHCNEEKVGAEVIRSDLRNLSNNISFFCTEHQRMSQHFLKPLQAFLGKGVPQSRSAHSFPKLTKSDSADATTISSTLSPGDADSSGYSSSQDSLEDRSYAVKVLRSISVSLIDPLMQEAAKGFSPELFKSIVVALQKISWKVEACLSFNNCQPGNSRGFEIHSLIFDPDQTEKVRDMMIKALPPEEPKLQSAVAEGSRHSSISTAGGGGRSAGFRKSSDPAVNTRMPERYVPPRKKTSLEITPNGRPSGAVLTPDELPQVLKELKDVSQKPVRAAYM